MVLKECSMSKRAYKTYTKEFKVEAIRLAEESDQPMTQVARKLGLRVNQIYKWPKQLEEKHGDAFSGKRTATDKDAEIQRLNKALAASQEENEFLKKRPCSLRRTSHEVCSDSPMPPPILGSDDVSSDGCLS